MSRFASLLIVALIGMMLFYGYSQDARVEAQHNAGERPAATVPAGTMLPYFGAIKNIPRDYALADATDDEIRIMREAGNPNGGTWPKDKSWLPKELWGEKIIMDGTFLCGGDKAAVPAPTEATAPTFAITTGTSLPVTFPSTFDKEETRRVATNGWILRYETPIAPHNPQPRDIVGQFVYNDNGNWRVENPINAPFISGPLNIRHYSIQEANYSFRSVTIGNHSLPLTADVAVAATGSFKPKHRQCRWIVCVLDP